MDNDEATVVNLRGHPLREGKRKKGAGRGLWSRGPAATSAGRTGTEKGPPSAGKVYSLTAGGYMRGEVAPQRYRKNKRNIV